MPEKRPTYFILNENNRVVAVEMMEWAEWFGRNTAKRIIAKAVIEGMEISTVFVGMDMNFRNVRPLLFETMIFGGHRDGETYRYSTMTAAKINHRKIVREIIEHAEAVKEIVSKKISNDNTQTTFSGGME